MTRYWLADVGGRQRLVKDKLDGTVEEYIRDAQACGATIDVEPCRDTDKAWMVTFKLATGEVRREMVTDLE